MLPARTPPQKKIQSSLARFKFAVWGRQSGKTTNGIWTMATRPFAGRANGIYWYVLQTHSASEVAFNRYIKLFPKDSWQYLWAKKPNESEKTVFLTGGREVHFKSGQNYQDLRIETLDGSVLDELRQQPYQLWPEVIRPMLGRRKGWAELYTTPSGFDHCYDLYEETKKDPEWAHFHAPSTEAWWWTAEEIDSAKRTMSEAIFAQEILAEFRDLTRGKAYVNFGEHNISDVNPFSHLSISPHLPIILGTDYNLSPMAWSLGQVNVGKAHWFYYDEIHLESSHTQEASEAAVAKLEGLPNEVWVCGDATSKAGQRAAAGQSDYDILMSRLRAANIKAINRTPDSNPLVRDRVNTANAYLKNAAGVSSLWVHPRCKNLIKDFQRVVWKENNAVLDEGPRREQTHATDSATYPLCEITPLRGVRDVGGPRMAVRQV